MHLNFQAFQLPSSGETHFENNVPHSDVQESSLGVPVQGICLLDSGNTLAHLGDIHQKISQEGALDRDRAAVSEMYQALLPKDSRARVRACSRARRTNTPAISRL